MTTTALPPLTKKDFQTDQEVRWCPGCGDYAILSAVQSVFPELGIPRENFVVVSGIGCSSRFPYYMNTYGFHTIHGRAPAVASGDQDCPPRVGSLGRHRRWRRPCDRRQPHNSHAAPECRHQGAAVQQSHLWSNQGPVFTDFRIPQDDQVHALRLARPAVQSNFAGHRRGSHVRCSFRRHLSSAPEGNPEGRGGASRAPPSWKSCKTATFSTMARGSA